MGRIWKEMKRIFKRWEGYGRTCKGYLKDGKDTEGNVKDMTRMERIWKEV